MNLLTRSVRSWLSGLMMVAGLLVDVGIPQSGAAAELRFGSSISRPDTARPIVRTLILGYSVDRRAIVATEVATAGARRSLLVIGSIAGDEPGGIAIATYLASRPGIPRVNLWLVPDLNPDGASRGTRVNALGVDLNRNFPFAWRRFGEPGSRNYPGTSPLSEPESQAMATFILRVRPTLGIWLHQPYGLIDDSEGPRVFETALAHATALPLERLTRYPGSAIGWENHVIPNSAFDVELPGGSFSRSSVTRYAEAIRLIARDVAQTHATTAPA
jgi:protein MpaA